MSLPRALLLDTHAAIWLMEGQLSASARDVVVAASLADGVFVSIITAWEIGLLARNRGDQPPRMEFLPDPHSWFAALMRKPTIREAPLTASAAIASASLPGDLHGDPADRLLIATARERNIPLLTRDSKILAYADAKHVLAIPC